MKVHGGGAQEEKCEAELTQCELPEGYIGKRGPGRLSLK